MPAYCIQYLGEYGGRVKSYIQVDGQRQAYLRLLHLVLSIHLRDDFVHVGLQDHAAHHHLCQDVVDLGKMRYEVCFNMRTNIS